MKKRCCLSMIILLTICIFPCMAQRIQPADLEYQGAFRLPDSPGMPDNVSWEWNSWASALTYYPSGDPNGPWDGYPGSLFGVGHDHTQYVSEITIPIPVISPGKDVGELNTAETLQTFHDIRGGLFDGLEMPRVGLEYLPHQGDQTTDKLYFAWGDHLDEGGTRSSHGWCELNLSDPQTAGAWRIGEYWNYVTGDYIFAIPTEWADANTPGMVLATGRFRDGGQGTMGPPIIAYGPWNDGNPPPAGSTLSATPLLYYGTVYEDDPPAMNDYHHSDEWSGGAWLTAGDNSAVIFVGTKGQGDCWYGCPDGTDQPPWPCEDRGWWSTSFIGQMLFYDTAELAAVSRGDMESWEPQPFATMDIDEYLFHVDSTQQWYHVGAVSFDRDNGLLYVFEPLADEYKSVIHVWKVNAHPTGIEGEERGYRFKLHQNYPNPFNPETTIEYQLLQRATIVLTIFDVKGHSVRTLFHGTKPAGDYSVQWDGRNEMGQVVASGMYFYRIEMRPNDGEQKSFIEVKKMVCIK